MKRIFYYLGLGIALFFQHSCTTTMYTSSAVNAPLLTQKGEVRLTGATGNIQTAVAVGNHVGIITGMYYKNYTSGDIYQHRGSLVEAGAGYFESPTRHVVFEAYAGGGSGHVYKSQTMYNGDNSTYQARFNGDAYKLFMQSGFGFTSDIFEIGLTTRVSTVRYYRFKAVNYTEDELRRDDLDNITKPWFAFAEPAITTRFGFRSIKLQAQYGLTLNLGASIRHTPDFGSVGIIFSIK
jgi:hypothetical protein